MDLRTFIDRWYDSGAAERSGKDSFLNELADVLGVSKPEPKKKDPALDRYVFEYDVPTLHEGGKVTTRKIDLYKHECFILEAKQGSFAGDKKQGFARRGTPQWDVGMRDAYGQALGYAASMDDPPPFIVICDIGYCFDLYASFDRGIHRPYPNALAKRIFFRDLATEPKHLDTLRRLWTEPLSLDPSRHAAKVTRDVAERIAKLARSLEDQGHSSELVAKFLMRCLFTMFAEDVGLLPARTFTNLIREHWLPNPPAFAGFGGISALWQAMNDGATAPLIGKLLRFNGGLFADTSAIPLKRADLELLLDAAEHDWSEVEPAIFGTLLERALNPKERHMLGAHFTPRAYVERLVRPTIEEPLREEWENVQAEVRQIVLAAGREPKRPALSEEEYLALGRGTKAQRAAVKQYEDQVKAREAKLDEARNALRGFLRKLAALHVLDPACGSGNFLYVSLDVFKRIESEILAALHGLGVRQEMLAAKEFRVTPGQFLGIEKKRWAKEIADLVLWIGYLQWHYKSHGKAMPPPEPVLEAYKNIECRDAVLAWDGEPELVRDENGKPITRWDGETHKKSPVTGEDVPDEAALVPVHKYLNPRAAEWPNADFVVGNPPFVGTRRMRLTLGDGYVRALAASYPNVPETADYVMYWWDKAATLVRSNVTRRFGLITTNSIAMILNRPVLQHHLGADRPLSIVLAIPDHPWVDSADGAAVRVAMTIGVRDAAASGALFRIMSETSSQSDEVDVKLSPPIVGRIGPDLRVGATPAMASTLRSNAGIAYWGVKFYGDGFILTPAQAAELRRDARDRVRPFVSGRDLASNRREQYVIDCDGLDETELRSEFPSLHQWLTDRVKPVRAHNPRAFKRDRWWIFGENQPGMRRAIAGLPRFIGTPEVARHRVFQFVDAPVIPEGKVCAVGLSDGFSMGVLSSRVHVVWALAAGGRLGVGNDPCYNKTRCFDPFPFPNCTATEQQRVRDLAEALDAHRKRQQSQHPDLTMTGMYNVLEKLRSGDALSDKELVIHKSALVSTLRTIHDDLDAAVFDAYGWPHDLTDEQILQKLVDLNAERAEEERRGYVRWLRPDFQNPAGAKPATQEALVQTEGAGEAPEAAEAPEAKPWPKKLAERIAAVRDRVTAWGRAASVEEVAAAFKRAPRKDVEEILDSLAAVGVLTVLDAEGGKRWRATARAA